MTQFRHFATLSALPHGLSAELFQLNKTVSVTAVICLHQHTWHVGINNDDSDRNESERQEDAMTIYLLVTVVIGRISFNRKNNDMIWKTLPKASNWRSTWRVVIHIPRSLRTQKSSHQQRNTRPTRRNSTTHRRRAATNELRCEHEETWNSDFQAKNHNRLSGTGKSSSDKWNPKRSYRSADEEEQSQWHGESHWCKGERKGTGQLCDDAKREYERTRRGRMNGTEVQSWKGSSVETWTEG